MGRPLRGWWEFRLGDRRMLIKNINAQPAETATGADLVYVSRDPDSIVLVQYKMPEDLAESGRPMFRLNKRLRRQVGALLSLESRAASPQSQEYRLGRGFTFFKFIAVVDGSIGQDELVPGQYVPTELLASDMKVPKHGPRGGEMLYMDEQRWLDSETFVRLVQDRWLGSVGDVTVAVGAMVGLYLRDGPSALTIAIDQPASSPTA
jgi:hypothetical protein